MTVAARASGAPTSADFLDLVLGGVEGWITVFSIQRLGEDVGARWTDWAGDGVEAARYADGRADECDVWFGCATRRERLDRGRRGGVEDCVAIGALWLDIDIAGPGHRIEGLPETESDAMALVERFPIPPSVIVHSGGGLQVWWALAEPLEAEVASPLLTRWGATWARIAEEVGVHVDNVFNLDRIMRLPGTFNRKEGGARPVRIVGWYPERRWGTDDVDQWLQDPPEPPEAALVARVPWIGPERPGDAFSATPGAAEAVLEAAGFHSPKRLRDRIDYTRPGKEARDGASASVYLDDGHATVWSSTVPGIDPGQGYDAFGLYARLFHGGDFTTASDELEARGYGTKAVDTSWLDELPAVGPGTGEGDPPATDTPSTMAIRWTDELAGDMPPEPPVLVENLLRRGELAALAAPRAIGKTWMVMGLADALARGEGTVAGTFAVTAPAKVLYLQGELDEWGSAMRWRMLTGLDQPLPRIAESFTRLRFRTVRRQRKRMTPDGPVADEWTDAEIPAVLEATVSELGVDLVVVDPWAVYLAAAENSNDEVEAVLGSLRDISLRTGVAWLIVHHITGKAERTQWTEPEDLWRGATRLADWASTRVTVLPHYTPTQAKKLGMDRHEARRFVDIHVLRRNGEPVPTAYARRSAEGRWEPWNPDDDLASDVDVLLQALREAGGELSSVRAVVEATGLSSYAASQAVRDAVEFDLVEVRDGPRRSQMIVLLDRRQNTETTARRPRDDDRANSSRGHESPGQTELSTTARRFTARSDRAVEEVASDLGFCDSSDDRANAPSLREGGGGRPDGAAPPPTSADSETAPSTATDPTLGGLL